MNWDEGVNRIRELGRRRRFEVGDICCELCPMGLDHSANGSGEMLRRLATETEESFESLREWRAVSGRTPVAVRTATVSWYVFREIAWVSDEARRAALLHRVTAEKPNTDSGRWTVTAIREVIGKPGTYIHSQREVEQVRKADASTKVEVLKALAADPEVQAAVEEHGEARESIAKLQARAYAADARRAPADDPIMQQLTERGALLDLDQAIRRFTQEIAVILPRLQSIPAAERDPMANLYFLRRALAELHEATRAVEAFVLQGQAKPDALITVLQGGRDG